MRHQTAWAGVVMALMIGSSAEAAMLTLPEDPKSGHRFDVGVDYENTLRRELEKPDASDNDVKRFQAVYGKIQYAVDPLLNVYAKLGEGSITHKIEDYFVSGIGRRDLTFKSDWGLAWGGGITGALSLPLADLKLGYDVNYHSVTADVDEVKHENLDSGDPAADFSRTGSNPSGQLQWREYQAAVWIANPVKLDSATLIPYLGAKWSRLTLDDDDFRYSVTDAGSTQTPTVDTTSHNVTRWGAVLGLRLVYDKRIVIVIEGHEIDDESVITSVSWRF